MIPTAFFLQLWDVKTWQGEIRRVWQVLMHRQAAGMDGSNCHRGMIRRYVLEEIDPFPKHESLGLMVSQRQWIRAALYSLAWVCPFYRRPTGNRPSKCQKTIAIILPDDGRESFSGCWKQRLFQCFNCNSLSGRKWCTHVSEQDFWRNLGHTSSLVRTHGTAIFFTRVSYTNVHCWAAYLPLYDLAHRWPYLACRFWLAC